MKRRREREMEERETEIRSAIDELLVLVKLNHVMVKLPSSTHLVANIVANTVANTAGVAGNNNIINNVNEEEVHEVEAPMIHTRPFLSLCYSIVRVLDKIGPTMAVLRQDIFNNIQRLERMCESDAAFANMIEIIKKEAVEGTAKKTDSCTKALLWLTRSLDFTAALLENIARNPKGSMEQMVADSYEFTLKPWHGWISTAAYKVALKLVPETNTFVSLLMAKGQDLKSFQDQLHVFLSLLHPLLQDVHTLLRIYRLEKFKAT